MFAVVALLAAILLALLLGSESGRLFVVMCLKGAGVLAAIATGCLVLFLLLALRNGHPG